MATTVGVITFHFCQNYGALLQNYALIEFLRNSNANPCTLNMISKLQENNNSMYSCKKGVKRIIRNLLLCPFHKSRAVKKSKFDLFVDKYLNVTKRVYNCQELKELIENDMIDIIISGSDQVWNPYNHDFDVAFFFPFDTKAKKYGYAISIGKAQNIDLQQYKDYIERFESIGVRENMALDELGGYSVEKHKNVDPVLLLDRNKWMMLSSISSMKINEKYIICYFINKKMFNTYYALTKKIEKMLNLKVYIINAGFGINSLHRNVILDAGPEDFLYLLSHSQFVCTDSFHGTVFSTIFRKQFISFIPSNNMIDSRVFDFLNIAGLCDRAIYGDDTMIDLSHFINSFIDFDSVDTKIQSEKISSIDYLKRILENSNG